MKQPMYRLALVTAFLLTGVFGVASPALASDSCNNPGATCLYQNTFYSGGKYVASGDNYTYHDGDTFSNGYHLYDAVSSAQNVNTTYTICLFAGHHYEGTALCIPPRIYPGNLGDDGFNDAASSHYWL
jgi:peptidase inhibitor family I36